MTLAHTVADDLLTGTNAARRAAGLGLLQWQPLLAQVAQDHAAAMAREGWFDHIDTLGRGVGERLMAAGYVYGFAGENISAGKPSAQETIDWWLQSASHRDNILHTNFVHAGFGYCFVELDRNQFHHYWVMVLASPLPATEN